MHQPLSTFLCELNKIAGHKLMCKNLLYFYIPDKKRERERKALKKDTIYSSIQYWQMSRPRSA